MKNIKRIIKNIKRPKVSPYYAATVKTAAAATLVVIVLAAASAVVSPLAYHWVAGNSATTLQTVSYVWSVFATVCGGFGLGLLSMKRGIGREERIVRAGAYGVIAYFLYTATFGLLLMLDLATTNRIMPFLTALGPAFALIITAAAAVIDRRTSDGSARGVMGLFLTVVWAALAWDVIQQLRFAGNSMEAARGDFSVYPMAFVGLLIPLAVSAAFYFLLKRIGRLTRAFYATYLTLIAFLFTITLGSFNYEPDQIAAFRYEIIVIGLSLFFLAMEVFFLARARRVK